MRTSMRKSMRWLCPDFLLGVLMGFIGALVLARRAVDTPAAPPAPRPLEVPVEVPYEEPVPIPWHRIGDAAHV